MWEQIFVSTHRMVWLDRINKIVWREFKAGEAERAQWVEHTRKHYGFSFVPLLGITTEQGRLGGLYPWYKDFFLYQDQAYPSDASERFVLLWKSVRYMHRNDCVFGDLTPRHVRASDMGVVLIDLESVLFRGEPPQKRNFRFSRGWSAPECAVSGATEATDLFALGKMWQYCGFLPTDRELQTLLKNLISGQNMVRVDAAKKMDEIFDNREVSMKWVETEKKTCRA